VSAKLSLLSRFGIKFIEVAGAGFASALCAYCLAQLGKPPVAPAPIVQVLPASDDAIRMARDDYTLLTQLARRESENQKKSDSVPATATASGAAAPRPAQAAQTVQARRNPKIDSVAATETAPRNAEPLSIQPAVAASNSTPRPPAKSLEALVGRDGLAVSAPNSGEEERPLLARLKQIPSWFLPDNDRIFGEVPRPPMAVGEFLRSAM
jgi:hypothetical protein